MTTQIKVPDMGESVVEATIARWMKNEGDAVKAGEAVVELETDKVNLEVAAERDGVLSSIQHPPGDDVKIGDVLATIDEAGASTPALKPRHKPIVRRPRRRLPHNQRRPAKRMKASPTNQPATQQCQPS